MFSKYLKKSVSWNIKFTQPRKNSLSKYRKIYKIQSNNRSSIEKEKQKIMKLKSLYGNKNKDLNQQKRNNWENLTKPKLPFSKRKNISKETKAKQICSLQPSMLYHDKHVINWINKKYSKSVVEKSIYTILPEKEEKKENKKETELQKRQRKMMEYIESQKDLSRKEKIIKINPKYFFGKETFEKIKKLRDLFLDFDLNEDRKISVDEMTNLFNRNNIKANEDELVQLFFKDKKYNKKDYFKLYLNFYQFLKLSIEREHDFRLFMRKIRKKYEEEIKKDKSKKDQNIYIPMNLNMLLDFFISKAKEKSSINKIEKAIEIIDKFIKSEKKEEEVIKINSYNNSNTENLENRKSKIIKDSSNLNSSKNIEDEKEYENLNFNELVDEFSKLFNISDFERNLKIDSEKKHQFKTTNKFFNVKENNKDNSQINKIKENIFDNHKINKQKNNSIFYEYSNNAKDIMGNIIKKKMNQSAIIQLNMNNYNKYHNIELALDATKEELDKMQMNKFLNQNPSINYRLKNFFINKNNPLKSIPRIGKKCNYSINDNSKKNFLFKYKNLAKNISMKLFTKKELISFNRNNFSNESNNKYINGRNSNLSLYKYNQCKSASYYEREKSDLYSKKKLDYVPIDLF